MSESTQETLSQAREAQLRLMARTDVMLGNPLPMKLNPTELACYADAYGEYYREDLHAVLKQLARLRQVVGRAEAMAPQLGTVFVHGAPRHHERVRVAYEVLDALT